jgi:hypothetical protein
MNSAIVGFCVICMIALLGLVILFAMPSPGHVSPCDRDIAAFQECRANQQCRYTPADVRHYHWCGGK